MVVCYLVSTISSTTTTTHTLEERLEHGTVGGYNYYHFNFIQHISLDTVTDSTNSYGHGFPRTIIQIIQQNPFNKIRLSFRKGRWPKASGSAFKTTMDLVNPLTNGALSAQGVELEATAVTNTAGTATTKDFLLLADCLSGPFCSSLSTIKDISETQDRTGEERSFNAILPNEAVCTENLTPWIRLLPPGTPTPIKALLPKGDVLFSKPFHQLDVLITVQHGTVVLEQNLLFLSVEQYPLPQPTILDNHHPFLSSSTINYNDEEISKTEPITIETKILGSGLSSGIFVLNVEIISPVSAAAGTVVEIEQLLPSYIKIFMADIQLPPSVSTLSYRPGDVVTKKASQINLAISLDSLNSFNSLGSSSSNDPIESNTTNDDKNSNKIITIKIPFLRSLLSTTEYPFDPARGFDIPPPRIIGGNRARKILLPLPTPDFTMPYNVITLTTTIIVLFYGTLFNLLYRSFHSRHPSDSGAPLKSL